MKKGIIMEMDDTFLILMTPEGEFMHAERKNQDFQIGEEIHFSPIESAKFPNKLKKFVKIKPVWAVSAAAALILIFSSLIPVYQNNKAYAYVSIDVNPSIELGVNQNMQVVELKGFNKDGKKIVSMLHNWKKRDVSDVAEIILTEMKNEGFLNHNEPVIISTVHSKEAEKEAEKKLIRNIDEIKQTASKQKLEVTVYPGTKDDLEKAHKLGITTGQYQKQKEDSSLSRKKENQPKHKPEEKKNTIIEPKQNNVQVPPGKKEHSTTPKQKSTSTPPGQQKKQTEKTPQQKKPQSEISKQSKDKQVPPGHQKNSSDKQVQKNKGQEKNKDQQKNKGQEKKKDQQKSKQNNGKKESNQKEKNHK